MTETITSKVIGPLNRNNEFEDWWDRHDVEIPFFDNKKLTVTFSGFLPDKDKKFIDEADNALVNFLKLSKNDREAISDSVYKNCMDFLEAVEFDEADEDLRKIKKGLPRFMWVEFRIL